MTSVNAMTLTPQRTERLHALDSLRAIMMLLGLVLHSAISYGTFDYGEAWSLKDPETTSPLFDLMVGYIHAFRMPVFFAIAGFFGALLFYERSPRAMVRNRLARIVYPFLVFVFLLWPPVVFAWVFTSSAMAGTTSPLVQAVSLFNNPFVFIPANPMHLWFLDYLIVFSFAGWFLGLLLRRSPAVSSRIRRVYELLMRSAALRPFAFAALTFVVLYLINSPWPEKTGGFLPAWQPLFNYFTFYLFGWLLYGSRHLVTGLTRYGWPLVIVASLLFLAKTVLADSLGRVASMALNALTVWCFVFGITGLFVRYFTNHSVTMRFVSDASYWFYLIHLPLTALGAGLLIGSGLPAGVKFVLVLGGTTVVCWVTYFYLVRSTFMGKFLNGRKYTRALSSVPSQ
jgi:peptidoglycan/LPS O-acetylase OafA/YrhL